MPSIFCSQVGYPEKGIEYVEFTYQTETGFREVIVWRLYSIPFLTMLGMLNESLHAYVRYGHDFCTLGIQDVFEILLKV